MISLQRFVCSTNANAGNEAGVAHDKNKNI